MNLLLNSLVPVVYVIFGQLPEYLFINIELALRKNPVLVIGDRLAVPSSALNAQNLFLVDAAPFMSGARDFGKFYRHLAGADSGPLRVKRELQNIQRWFLLRDLMRAHKLHRVFFADGDSSIFGNMTAANLDREAGQCSAIVNVEVQTSFFHWVAAGESSFWTLEAISDFCQFTLDVYKSKEMHGPLNTKNAVKPAVVDMSILWLWWTRHHAINDTAWIVPKPQLPKEQQQQSWTKNYGAFRYAKSLPLPNSTTTTHLTLCNGLDVVHGTVFDHMHGWNTNLQNFSIAFPLPYTHARQTLHGGRVDPGSSSTLLYFLSLHYQGQAKEFLVYDVCKYMKLAGEPAKLAQANQICAKARKQPHRYATIR